MYSILPYIQQRAKELNVEVFPSTKLSKKIDVFKDGIFVTSIGANGMSDYPTYLVTHGKAYADERRRLYKIRHQSNVGVAGFYASHLLW